MNIREAKQRGCPPEVLKMCKDAGVKSIGFGLSEGSKKEIDWGVVKKDLGVIVAEVKRRTK